MRKGGKGGGGGEAKKIISHTIILYVIGVDAPNYLRWSFLLLFSDDATFTCYEDLTYIILNLHYSMNYIDWHIDDTM